MNINNIDNQGSPRGGVDRVWMGCILAKTDPLSRLAENCVLNPMSI
jgi:hypothetical protein